MGDFAPYIGMALSPFFALVVIWLIARPIQNLVIKRMRYGLIKRILLFRWEV